MKSSSLNFLTPDRFVLFLKRLLMKTLLTAVRPLQPGLQGGQQHPSCDQNPGQRHLPADSRRLRSVRLNSSLHVCQWPGWEGSTAAPQRPGTYVHSGPVSLHPPPPNKPAPQNQAPFFPLSFVCLINIR